MYGILGIVVNEASRVQTKRDLSLYDRKSLLRISPYWKDVLRNFAMTSIKTSWSNFRWRQLVEEGPVTQRSLKGLSIQSRKTVVAVFSVFILTKLR